MRTIRTKVYKFSELSETAKDKAIEKLYDINVDFEWWESVYGDASNIGVTISEFDIDRQQIKGSFDISPKHTIDRTHNEHGKETGTYKTASKLKERWAIINEEDSDEVEEFEADAIGGILPLYLSMLRQEYDYQTSREAIIGTIEANEYEFTADGRMI